MREMSQGKRMKRKSHRHGFSLLEVAIAMAMAAVAMVYTYSMIAEGMKYQKKAVSISNAVQLAKVKMAQLDASTSLISESAKGEIPGYPGYSFETEVKEEEMDLLKLANGPGSDALKKKTPKDLLSDRDEGVSELLKKRGQSRNFETGGLLKVFRVRVSIFYPLETRNNKYTVETFRSAKY